jgi:hypothetical protein
MRSSVEDPDSGSGAFLTLGSGMGKKSGSGSGVNNPDHISESLEYIFWVTILKYFDADPGWKKFGTGINIPDLQHCCEAIYCEFYRSGTFAHNTPTVSCLRASVQQSSGQLLSSFSP